MRYEIYPRSDKYLLIVNDEVAYIESDIEKIFERIRAGDVIKEENYNPDKSLVQGIKILWGN